ncbi:hypothetical protein BKA69DRAFT_1034566 [Paraphysoderma sedebokerense]|nr:hypothetical protein BKA69DRAFT_1034566 [Paraphysoderma sedebokerense]
MSFNHSSFDFSPVSSTTSNALSPRTSQFPSKLSNLTSSMPNLGGAQPLQSENTERDDGPSNMYSQVPKLNIPPHNEYMANKSNPIQSEKQSERLNYGEKLNSRKGTEKLTMDRSCWPGQRSHIPDFFPNELSDNQPQCLYSQMNDEYFNGIEVEKKRKEVDSLSAAILKGIEDTLAMNHQVEQEMNNLESTVDQLRSDITDKQVTLYESGRKELKDITPMKLQQLHSLLSNLTSMLHFPSNLDKASEGEKHYE